MDCVSARANLPQTSLPLGARASDVLSGPAYISQGGRVMARGDLNVATLSPMILTVSMAIVIGALLWGFTGMNLAGAVLVAVLIVAAGLLAVRMLVKRGGQAA
jgi:hypothetical protein